MNLSTKTLLFAITTFVVGLLCSNVSAQHNPNGIRTVVIDPGHGGKDPGAVRGKYLEKNFNLAVALKFGKLIEKNLPDVTVKYTRTTDVYIGLMERGDIANKAGADLFISIHTDAATNTSASGSSTFVMGMDKSEANLREAMRENDVVTYEEDYTTKYEGYVPGSTESYIIFSLMQYAYMDQSMVFADLVQKHYQQQTPMRNRGTGQRPYLVLWKTAMPSVLTEMGFISNDADRRVLASEEGQDKIAQALFNAFKEYKTRVEGNRSESAAPATEKESPKREQKAETTKTTVKYCVQLCSSKSPIATNSSHFKSYRGKVTERRIDGWYKYYLAGYSTFAEAKKAQNAARRNFKDCFIVAFEGNNPISLDEARRKTKE